MGSEFPLISIPTRCLLGLLIKITMSSMSSLIIFPTIREQTSYLSQVSQVIYVEKIVMWRIFSFPCMTIAVKLRFSLHVEKFQMPSHDRCGKIWNSPHLACVWCRKRRHICKIYAIFLKKISFVKNELCREIRFVVIYALLCGEKFVQKFSMWRKNDKYEVCMILIIIEGVCAEILAFYRFQRALNLIMSGAQPVTLVMKYLV